MILGVTGTFSAGKDIGAEYLAERFNLLDQSTSDMVRAVAKRKYGNVDRQTLHDTANEIRAERGSAALVEVALETYEDQRDDYQGTVITGIRSLGEAKEILKAGGHIIFIDAPIKLRYERSQKRERQGEDKSYEEFVAIEQAEMNNTDGGEDGQNILGIKELADTVVINGGSLGQYFADLEQYVQMMSNRS